MTWFDVLVSFTKVGLLGFGGGPAMIPLIQLEVVNHRGWLETPAFADALAFGNALPGPIATKLAGYVGYQVAGPVGALAGLVGVSAPAVVAMLLLAGLYQRHKDRRFVRDFLRGVRPVVIAMLAVVVWDLAPGAVLATGSSWWTAWPYMLVAIAAMFAALRFRAHPALLIVVGSIAGLFILGG